MNTEYRYKLASNKAPKLNCPYCGAKKHWQRYIDTKTGEILPEHWGRCDNDNKCGQWNNPYKDGYAKAIWKQEQGGCSEIPNNWKPQQKKAIPQPKPEPVFFDFETFKKTLNNYHENIFLNNLLNSVAYPFEMEDIEKVIKLYGLGTIANGQWKGAITFPFIDKKNNVRTIQVKQFDKDNHTTGTTFLHALLKIQYDQLKLDLPRWLKDYLKQEKMVSCLFGEHLLTQYPSNPVALVEAPKTAIYGTLYFGFPTNPKKPIWLAVYNAGSFTFEKIAALNGRSVYVFPDLSKDGKTFEKWKKKAEEIKEKMPGIKFAFFDLLERDAPQLDKIKGLDIADYLIKTDWRACRHTDFEKQPKQSKQEKMPIVEEVPPPVKSFVEHFEP